MRSRPALAGLVADLIRGLVGQWRARGTARAPDRETERSVLRRRLGLRSWTARPEPVEPRYVASADALAPWVPGLPHDELVPLDQTSERERAWVARHVAEHVHGDGAVVELGSWLGAITLAVGEGLRRRSGPPVAFHSYDRFRLHDQSHIFAAAPEHFAYEEGGSFRAVFDRRTASLAGLVEVHEGPVEGAAWDGSPVELLVNDVSKTWTTWMAVRRGFYGALVPGSGVVVEQDFGHPYTPWLHLSHYRWRDHFEVLGAIPGTGTVVMRLTRPLPRGELERDDLLEGVSPAEIQDAFDWAESVVDVDHRPAVRGARIMLYVLHGDTSVAADEVLSAVDEGLMGRELVGEILPLLAARRMADKRVETEGSLKDALKEALSVRSRDAAARKRGDPWRAY